MNTFIRCTPAIAACGLLAFTASQAVAQSAEGSFELQEVVVTATKVETDLQKTALSIVALKGDDLAKEGKDNLQEILASVPNVSMQGGLSQGSFFFIRGVGNNPVFGQDASVVFTTNGVFNQRGNSIRGNFFDIDRVEVSRGPQNVYTGRSAEGGSINIIPNEPHLGNVELSGSLEGGNHRLAAGQGMVNLPLNDIFALRTAFTVITRDGFNSDGSYDEATVAARARLLFEPTDNFKVIVTEAYTHIGGKGDVQAITGPIDDSSSLSFPSGYYFNTNPPDTNQDYYTQDLYLDLTWKTPLATVYFQPTWQYNKLFVNGWSSNYCCSPTSYVSSLAAGFTGATSYARSLSLQRNNSYQTQRSAELRLSSPDDQKIKWMVGGYYYRNYQPINVGMFNGGSVQPVCTATPPATTCVQSTANATQVGTAPDFRAASIYPESNRRLETSKDFYGQFTVPFTDTWRFTGGARYSNITKSRNAGLGFFLEPDGAVINGLGNGVPLDNGVAGNTTAGASTGPRQIPNNDIVFNYGAAVVNYSRVNWKAVFEHDLSAKSLVYAMVSTGWKSGSFINIADPTAICPNDRPANTGASKFPIVSTVNLGDCLTTVPAGTTFLAPGYTNTYKPEYLTSYEVGSKNQFMNDRLRLNASIFDYHYTGYQFNVNLPVINPLTGVDPDSTSMMTLNADKVIDYGAELESSFLITTVDKIDLNASFLHAVFDSVTIPPAPSAAAASTAAYISATQWAAALSNHFPLPHSPRWTASPSYAHIFKLSGNGATVTATVDGNYQASYVLSLPGNAAVNAGSGFTTGSALLDRPWLYTQPAFWKFNASLAYTSADGKWGVTAYGHNISNKMTLTQISVPTAVTGLGTPATGLQNVGFQADEPRMFGIVVNARL